MNVYYVVDDGHYTAKTEEAFVEGFTESVGGDIATELLEGYKVMSDEDIDFTLLGEITYPDGEDKPAVIVGVTLREELNKHVAENGEVFAQLTCESY